MILPLYTQHYILLNKNLLYTGLTRARKLVILSGRRKPWRWRSRRCRKTSGTLCSIKE
ncbi:ATP-binding domain-containing protein [Laspinema sp. C3]|uniref:ATP-binding domain-containing protein n=1 Tax=Laspinema olomoucense D3b TaxID=2953688 RepID=A0ABT2NGJ5_9CYAN|nr:ATP-binding domain-containing protein [Laspinema sp. D3b]